jgi:hypothetical protein
MILFAAKINKKINHAKFKVILRFAWLNIGFVTAAPPSSA